MYRFLTLVFLGALCSAILLYEVSASRPEDFQVSPPGRNTFQPRQSVLAKFGPADKAGGNGSDPSVCRFLIEGYGPLPEEDTPEAFRDFLVLQDMSTKAVEPNGFVLTVENADGSIQPGDGYLGLEFLEDYNTTRCAVYCDNSPRCGSFNICQRRTETEEVSEELTERRLRT